MEREEAEFGSGGERCAVWIYHAAGDAPGPCVVMSHGFSLTRHDGLDRYAQALAGAGATVVAFDHRYLGDSGGQPRQRFRVRDQVEDVHNAVSFARGLDRVDAARVIVWGYSFSGGNAVTVTAEDPLIAGAILLCPFLDGTARLLAALRSEPAAAAWIVPRALRDRTGRHNLIPVTGPPGSRAAMNFPGESDGFARAVRAGSPWRNEISPGIFATVALYRPVRHAAKLDRPVWIGSGTRDRSVSERAIARFAHRATGSELHDYPVDHFEPFHAGAGEQIADDQADWLKRNFTAAA